MCEETKKAINERFILKNEEIFSLLRADLESEDRSEDYRGAAIARLVELNDRMLNRIASGLNYKEYGICNFEDAKQIVVMAFLETIETTLQKGETSWERAYIPNATSYNAKKVLHLMYRAGGISESYENYRRKMRKRRESHCTGNMDGFESRITACKCYDELQESDFPIQKDFVDEIVKNETEEILMKHYNSDLLSPLEREIISKHIVEEKSFYRMAEEMGIHYKKLQRQYRNAMARLSAAVMAETGEEEMYEYYC